jgi:thiol:disulfide interchange protein DsbD
MKALLLLLVVGSGLAVAQTNLLTVTPPSKLHAKRGETVTATVRAQLRPGYHCNSNTPADAFLIPLKLTWNADPLQVGKIAYPKPQLEKYDFSEKPISVFSGDFDITTEFNVPAKAPNGPAIVTGKLRYQACNNTMCFPPKTVDVPLSVEIQ